MNIGKEYNVFSGGRIESFDNDNILFSIGFSYVKNSAQKKIVYWEKL